MPALSGLPPSVRDAATALSVGFNAALEATLSGLEAALPITVVRVDIFALLAAVVADPPAFGLAEVRQPCITPFTRVRPFCARADTSLSGTSSTRLGPGTR